MERIKEIVFLLALSAIAIGNIQAVLPKKFYLISNTGQKFEVPGQLIIEHPSLQVFKKEFGPEGEEARTLSMFFDDNTVQALADAMNAFVRYPKFAQYPEGVAKDEVLGTLKRDLSAILGLPVEEKINLLQAAHYAEFKPLDDLLLSELAKGVIGQLGEYPSLEKLTNETRKVPLHPLWKKELARQYYLTYGKNLQKNFIDLGSYGFSLKELIDSKRIDMDRCLREADWLDLRFLRLVSLEGLDQLRCPTNKIKHINLSSNQLATLQPGIFSGFSKLETIFLSHNNLSTLRPNTFYGSTTLRTLDLSDNKLSNLYLHTFAGLTNLKYLHLESNKLSSLKPDILKDVPGLTKLLIYNNPMPAEQKEELRKTYPTLKIV